MNSGGLTSQRSASAGVGATTNERSSRLASSANGQSLGFHDADSTPQGFRFMTPHISDQRRYHSILQGRPIWFLLLTSPPLQSFLRSCWLDHLFPVAVDDVTHRLVVSSNDRASASLEEGSMPRFRVMGMGTHSTAVRTMDVAASAAAADAIVPLHAVQVDFARAPFDVSAAKEEAILGHSTRQTTIPTAMAAPLRPSSAVGTMSGTRQVLISKMRTLLTTPSTPLTSGAPQNQTAPVGPKQQEPPAATGVVAPLVHALHPASTPAVSRSTVIFGTAVPGNPVTSQQRPRSASQQRVSSTALLRDEVLRSRFSSRPLSDPDESPDEGDHGGGYDEGDHNGGIISQGGSADLWPTPMLSKYATWVVASRGRTLCDRFLEISEALAGVLRQITDPSVISSPPATADSKQQGERYRRTAVGNQLCQLLASTGALLHPIKAHMQALEEQLITVPDGSEEAHASHASEIPRHRFFDPSERALLELRVFGYLPPATLSSWIASNHAAATPGRLRDESDVTRQTPPQLITEMHALIRNRTQALKRHPADCLGASVELYLRSPRIQSAIDVWWDAMPKQQQASSGHNEANELQAGNAGASTTTSRYYFVQLAILMHAALVGDDVVLSSRKMFDSVRRLISDDWTMLFLTPPAVPIYQPNRGKEPAMTTSARYRSVLARGAQRPLSVDRELFQLALLLLLEPWMETTLAEERELALTLLFPHIFSQPSPSSSQQLRQFALKPLPNHVVAAAVAEGSLRPQSATVRSGGAAAALLSVEQCESSLRRASPSPSTSSPQRPHSAAASTSATHHRVLALSEDLTIAGVDSSLAQQLAERYRREAHGDLSLQYDSVKWHRSVLRQQLSLQLPIAVLPPQPTPLPPSEAGVGVGQDLQQRVTAALAIEGGARDDDDDADGLPASPSPFSTQPLRHDDNAMRHLHLLKRTFTPHDPSRSFGLERVMIQRLTKKIVKQASYSGDAGAAVSDRTEKQAAIVTHCTKNLIPPEYLHRMAKYHRPVVEQFRQAVVACCSSSATLDAGSGRSERGDAFGNHSHEGASIAELTSPYVDASVAYRNGSPHSALELLGGDTDAVIQLLKEEPVSLLIPQGVTDGSSTSPHQPPLLADVEALAALLRPPAPSPAHEPRETKRRAEQRSLLGRVSNLYVRRPHQWQQQQQQESMLRQAASGDRLEDHVSESLRRPLSALRAQRIAQHHSDNIMSTNPKEGSRRPASAPQKSPAPHHRQPEAVDRNAGASNVIYVSPFMNRGCLPVSNGGAYAAARGHSTK